MREELIHAQTSLAAAGLFGRIESSYAAEYPLEPLSADELKAAFEGVIARFKA